MLDISKTIRYGFIVLGALVLVGFGLKGRVTHEQFDSDKWKNMSESEIEWSLRWDMMNSLRNNYDLRKMTTKQVFELLGEPESKTENEFGYYLGYSKRGINTGQLTVEFSNNKVIHYSVWDG